MDVKRADVYYADLSPTVGSEQDGIRPVVIVQNDIGNKYSSTIIILPITSKVKTMLGTHVLLKKNTCGLKKDSIILAEQIRTLDKSRLKSKIGVLPDHIMNKVKEALILSCSLRSKIYNNINIYKILNDWN